MNNLTSKLAAIICTVLLSTACITAAVGPAQAGGADTIAAARVA